MRAVRFLVFSVSVSAAVACNSVLGIESHRLAAEGNDAGVVLVDAGSAPMDMGADSAVVTPPEAGADSGSGGGALPQPCGDAGACVTGGIFSLGQVPNGAVGLLPDGGVAAVMDDGFEFGNTVCDPSGVTCVTGAITP